MTNLTEKLKKGELSNGEYYYISTTYYPEIIQNYVGGFYDLEDDEIEEVLAEVPSYELWKAVHEQWKVLLEENKRLKHDVGNLGYKIKNQRHEIDNRLKEIEKLKELLEECRECFEFLTDDCSPWCPGGADTLLAKINQVLGEE